MQCPFPVAVAVVAWCPGRLLRTPTRKMRCGFRFQAHGPSLTVRDLRLTMCILSISSNASVVNAQLSKPQVSCKRQTVTKARPFRGGQREQRRGCLGKGVVRLSTGTSRESTISKPSTASLGTRATLAKDSCRDRHLMSPDPLQSPSICLHSNVATSSKTRDMTLFALHCRPFKF